MDNEDPLRALLPEYASNIISESELEKSTNVVDSEWNFNLSLPQIPSHWHQVSRLMTISAPSVLWWRRCPMTTSRVQRRLDKRLTLYHTVTTFNGPV